VNAAGVIRPLERRRVAQASFARALQNAVALVLALILHTAQAFIHRELASNLHAAVVQLHLLNFGRGAPGEKNEAEEANGTHQLCSMPELMQRRS